MMTSAQRDFALAPEDNDRLANLSGPTDTHLRQIELRLGVEIANRAHVFRVIGDPEAAAAAERVLRDLYDATESQTLDAHAVHLQLQESDAERFVQRAAERAAQGAHEIAIKVKRGTVTGRGPNQARYLHAIATHDINFGVGPAGTGKTFLAVAMAVDALNASRVQRILLVRPAVEAGEKLGFLPGDLSQKVDPYLRPLYDALHDMMDPTAIPNLLAAGVIEVAPLAFMRGRSLNDAFIILDEAQNTTPEQMKMFLTRLGFNSKMVVTGDVTQVDLPGGARSGLRAASDILDGIDDIHFAELTSADVVRHRLVSAIVDAYSRHEAQPELINRAQRRSSGGRARR